MPPVVPPVVVEPEDYHAAVLTFPDGQRPFGADCPIRLKIQAVLFHYGVKPEIVRALAGEGFEKLTDFRLANPHGNAEQIALFGASVAPHVTVPLHLARLIKAFDRLMLPRPLLAINVDSGPPSKKIKPASSAAVPVVSSVAASTLPAPVAASGVAASSASVAKDKSAPSTSKIASDTSSDESDSGSGDDTGGDAGVAVDDDDAKDTTSAVKKATVAQLFEKVNTEVF